MDSDYVSPLEIARLRAKMDGFAAKVSNKVMRKALKAGAELIKKQLAQSVSVASGRLQRAITYKITKSREFSQYSQFIAKIGAPKSDAYKLRFLERGTSAHLIEQPKLNRTIQHPGARPTAVVTKVFKSTHDAALNAIWRTVTSEIDKLL